MDILDGCQGGLLGLAACQVHLGRGCHGSAFDEDRMSREDSGRGNATASRWNHGGESEQALPAADQSALRAV
jgi:hypothetical protein